MSIFDTSYCGSIWHHGIKGQKWGVRRTPEELGHVSKGNDGVDKSQSRIIMDGEFYRSSKGFVIHPKKISEFCLKVGTKHSEEFFNIGYKETDEERLFQDIENGYDASRKTKLETSRTGYEKTSISMDLGVTAKRTFRTVWMNDGPDGSDRFVSAYVDRRLKRE